MMKDPYTQEYDRMEIERKDNKEISESSIVASNAIKYTAYVMLFFGFLYFLVQFILPRL